MSSFGMFSKRAVPSGWGFTRYSAEGWFSKDLIGVAAAGGTSYDFVVSPYSVVFTPSALAFSRQLAMGIDAISYVSNLASVSFSKAATFVLAPAAYTIETPLNSSSIGWAKAHSWGITPSSLLLAFYSVSDYPEGSTYPAYILTGLRYIDINSGEFLGSMIALTQDLGYEIDTSKLVKVLSDKFVLPL